MRDCLFKCGGIAPIKATDEMTQPVGQRNGQLFTYPSGGGGGGGGGGAVFPASVLVSFNVTVGGIPPVTYAYRAPDAEDPDNVVWKFKTVGVVDPEEFFNNEIPCVAHVDKIRDGFYVFVGDDQFIDGTGFVSLHCAEFNPLALEEYNIADDDNVYYVIPTTDNITINIKDSNEE